MNRTCRFSESKAEGFPFALCYGDGGWVVRVAQEIEDFLLCFEDMETCLLEAIFANDLSRLPYAIKARSPYTGLTWVFEPKEIGLV